MNILVNKTHPGVLVQCENVVELSNSYTTDIDNIRYEYQKSQWFLVPDYAYAAIRGTSNNTQLDRMLFCKRVRDEISVISKKIHDQHPTLEPGTAESIMIDGVDLAYNSVLNILSGIENGE